MPKFTCYSESRGITFGNSCCWPSYWPSGLTNSETGEWHQKFHSILILVAIDRVFHFPLSSRLSSWLSEAQARTSLTFHISHCFLTEFGIFFTDYCSVTPASKSAHYAYWPCYRSVTFIGKMTDYLNFTVCYWRNWADLFGFLFHVSSFSLARVVLTAAAESRFLRCFYWQTINQRSSV